MYSLVTLFSIIFVFGTVEMTKIKSEVVVRINCDDGRAINFTASGTADSSNCQETYVEPPMSYNTSNGNGETEVRERKVSTAPNGQMVLYAQIEGKTGPLAGAQITKNMTFPSVNVLEDCGGDQKIIKVDPEHNTYTIKQNGKTTECKGTMIFGVHKE